MHRREILRSVGDPAAERTKNDGAATDRDAVVGALARCGSVAADLEADALIEASGGRTTPVEALLARRLRGEPLAWITGLVRFCGLPIRVDPGVFVPRPQTQPLARRAARLLPDDGIAVDLCTGSGAVAAVMRAGHPHARVLATEIDPAAAACARRNGVDALIGDLDEPLPSTVRGRVDVVTAVVPYVPTAELHLLPRDTLEYEPRRALDGGTRGTALLMRAVGAAAKLLRPGGTVLLELGGDQAAEIGRAVTSVGLDEVTVHRDDEGQDRAIEARLPSVSSISR